MAEQTFLEAAAPWFTLIVGGVLIPLNTFLVRSAFTVKAALRTHEATDTIIFQDINDKLLDLKKDSSDQNTKLDDIRDRLPRKRGR